jgi:ubiquinone/menaquinone biosynthesis C-methylase UbiE
MKKFKILQKRHYDKIANSFDKKQKRDNRNHLNKIKAISEFLRVKNGEKVLEIGIGTGIHAYYFCNLNKKKNFKFYGLDLSNKMLMEARRRLNGLGFEAEFVQGDGENLPFKEESFDKVYISGSLHHFFSPQKGVKEILRVLKKGGKFCIMEPNPLFFLNLFASLVNPLERNIRKMTVKNFRFWLTDANHCEYSIINFAYTPPRPKNLIAIFDIFDKIFSVTPLLKNFSIMIFVFGSKK